MPTAAHAFKKINIISVTTILSIWALLYLPNLRTSPSWYGDEGLALTAGLNVAHGIPAHGSFWNTFWNSYAPYQPAYEFTIGWAARIANGDIIGPRLVNTLFALITAFVIAIGGRKIMGPIFSLGSALIFLTFEQNVIHFRWIFTHNLIALGFAIAFIGLSGKITRQSDQIAGLGLAISALALPLSIYGFIAGGLIRCKHPRSWLPVMGPYILVTGTSLALGYFLYPKEGFIWSDLIDTWRFYTEASQENGGGFKFIENILRFFLQDPFHAFGFITFLICLQRNVYAIGLSSLCIAFLLLQNRQNLTTFYYQAIIISPLISLSYGVAFQKIYFYALRTKLSSQMLKLIMRSIPFAIAVLFFLSVLPQSLSGTLKPRIAYWTTQSISEVEAAAKWINLHSSIEDLVICHQNIAWLLKCRTADYLQAATWAGYSTWPFKIPLRKDQFRYEPNLRAARYAVVADIDQRWTFHQPNVSEVISIFQSEKWRVVWSGDHYHIFENPQLYNPYSKNN